MAEFATWQWDDFGQWRDFGGALQAEMEASFQRREASLEMPIPPHGVFRMDLAAMQQITVRGRNPGYSRAIRRQARKIEMGYFILGHEGELLASDAAIDQVESVAVLEQLVEVLGKLADEPDNFEYRTLNLSLPELAAGLGQTEDAVEFLKECGFELIREGPARFLVFMEEDVSFLSDSRRQAEARLERVRKKQAAAGPVESNAVETNEAAASPSESNVVEPRPASGSDEDDGAQFSNEVDTAGDDKPNEGFNHQVAAAAAAASPLSGAGSPSGAASSGLSRNERRRLRNKARREEGQSRREERRVNQPNSKKRDGGYPKSASCPEGNAVSELYEVTAAQAGNSKGGGKGGIQGAECFKTPQAVARGTPSCQPEGEGDDDREKGDVAVPFRLPAQQRLHAHAALELLLPSGETKTLDAIPSSLEELLEEAKQASGLRFPLLQKELEEAGLGLASEPGRPLQEAAGLEHGARLRVEDFEEDFSRRLTTCVLRLRDLAAVAPLLDWEKPELLKLFMSRLRSLLEGPCESWCAAAGCTPESELHFGRALLRRLYADKALEARLEIVMQLLPSQKRGEKTVLKVSRSQSIHTALSGLEKLSPTELRRVFTVHFEGEIAEDHGGPRRDFFGRFGARLGPELPSLWRRLPKGALVPVADEVAEGTPKAERFEIEEVHAVYRACGRACGLAARHSDPIGEEFAIFFLHQVARDDSVSLPEMQRQLSETDGNEDIRTTNKVLQTPVKDLGMGGLTLSRTITGTTRERELIPGGRDVELVDDNKEMWLQLCLHDKLYGSLRKAADAFRTGILDIFGGTDNTCPLLVLLSPAELTHIWAGSRVGDEQLQKWKDVAVVSEEVAQQADWLWELLQEGNEEQRGQVLQFSTGLHRLATGGLQTFEVQPADGGDEALPRAMTCGNLLQLPKYSSKALLAKQLAKATEMCEGFQIL